MRDCCVPACVSAGGQFILPVSDVQKRLVDATVYYLSISLELACPTSYRQCNE